MSARSHAQDAVLAWRRRGQAPPGVDPASAVATFTAEPSLEEIIFQACEATTQEELEAFADLLTASRALSAAHRAGLGQGLTGYEVREMAIEDVCSAIEGLAHVADVRRKLDGAPSGEIGATIARTLDDTRRETVEIIARALDANDGIGSGLEGGAFVREAFGARRARYDKPVVTELEASDPRVQGLKGGEGR